MAGRATCRAVVGLSFVLALLTLGCSRKTGSPQSDPPKPVSKMERMVGEETVAILVNAEQVETYRLDSMQILGRQNDKLGRLAIDRFAVTGKGTVQGPEFAKKMVAILLPDSSYSEWSAKCFWPGVAFRFKRGDEHVDVAICFKCDDVDIQPNLQNNKVGFQLADFTSGARRALLALTKEAFPDDAEIQAIAER